MGIYEKPGAPFLDSLNRVFGFEPPRDFGYDTVESIQAMAEGKVRVFMAMGGNFISATPDTSFTTRALERCDLTVHVSTKLNRSHLVRGKVSLILPCLGRTERDMQRDKPQFVTVENSAGVVHTSRGDKIPASPHLLSEPRIVSGVAHALFDGSALDWNNLADDYDRIRDLIELTIPGFEQYNMRVRKPGGFYLPNGAREGTFKTASERALFTLNTPARHVLEEGEFLMMTIRSHDQYNTTIYGMNDRYRGIHHGRRVIFMNKDDIARAGLQAGGQVDIFSHYDGMERKAMAFTIVAYQIPAGNVATYFPEANEVVPHNRYARKSQTPISKSVVVRLKSKS
jgi:molybdopterin-dependent oxidoreductase alpha subunit